MNLPIYQVDAFASTPFSGNPAAVVPLEEWLPESLMQQIAGENNLSETAFFIKQPKGFHIRWFTPATEVNLCGHATLAAAHVLFREQRYTEASIVFQSLSGPLTVIQEPDGRLTLDLPAWAPKRLPDVPPTLADGLNCEVVDVYQHRDLLVELEDEAAVRNLHPDFGALRELEQAVIITARGKDCDFVSRFFAPHLGVDEDPVTGSAHTQLVPFWGDRLGKKDLYARQLSKRGGELWCTWAGERVRISGTCAFFLKGTISIP